MGIYRERFTTTPLVTPKDADSDVEWDTWEIYEQPAWRHYTHLALQKITHRTHHLEYRLDPLAERLHRLRCHDDCVTGEVKRVKPYWRTPEGMAEREKLNQQEGGWAAFMADPDKWDASVETYCGWKPLCAQIDLRVYHFGAQDRRRLGTLDGPPRPMSDED